MRHIALLATALTIFACSSCSALHLPRNPDACKAVRDASLSDRIEDPRAYDENLAKCAAELMAAHAAESSRVERETGSDVNHSNAPK